MVFWKADVLVGEPVAFQLSLTAKPDVSISSLCFSSLLIQFSGDTAPITVRHVGQEELVPVQRVDLGRVKSSDNDSKEVEGSLRWGAGATVVFSGIISSESPATIKASRASRSCHWC